MKRGPEGRSYRRAERQVRTRVENKAGLRLSLSVSASGLRFVRTSLISSRQSRRGQVEVPRVERLHAPAVRAAGARRAAPRAPPARRGRRGSRQRPALPPGAYSRPAASRCQAAARRGRPRPACRRSAGPACAGCRRSCPCSGWRRRQRMRLSGSLSISRAQLTSSSGTLSVCCRASLTRSAQFASICSLSAALSRPRSRNGPICSRGRVAVPARRVRSVP